MLVSCIISKFRIARFICSLFAILYLERAGNITLQPRPVCSAKIFAFGRSETHVTLLTD